MPLYDFACEGGHVTELRQGMNVEFIPCPRCSLKAHRSGVYRDQFISCETGPKGGTKSEPPRDEKSYRREYAEFREASEEVAHAYGRTDDPKVQAPNLYKEGLKQAKKQGAKIGDG